MKKKFFVLFNWLLFFNFFVHAQQFTIAVIPDSQNYSYYRRQKTITYPMNNIDIFYRQMAYIADNARSNGGSIDFAVHLGDLVESGKDVEWELATNALSIIDGKVPFLVVPGNHDYEKWIRDENKKFLYLEGPDTYIKYFGAESKFYKNKDYYCSSYNQGLSTACIFKNKDIELLIIGLEIGPFDDVLEWAQNILEENPGLPVIIVTHEFLSLRYDLNTPGVVGYSQDNLRSYIGGNTPQQIWDKFIRKNKQIFMVLCGHQFHEDYGESARTDIDDEGYPVYEILSNFQGRSKVPQRNIFVKKDCGDGWLRLMDFDLKEKQIKIKTYSTELKEYESDWNSQFTIKFTWDWNERFSK